MVAAFRRYSSRAWFVTAALAAVAATSAIAQQPDNPSVSVEGYTDAQGSTEQNQHLSQKRAQAVADQLIARGVDKSRVSVSGKGESAPVADNDTADGRANNRRVEIVLGSGSGDEAKH